MLDKLITDCTKFTIKPKGNFGCYLGVFQANRDYTFRKKINNEEQFIETLELFFGADCDMTAYNSDDEVLYDQNRKNKERKAIKAPKVVKHKVPTVSKDEIDKTTAKAKNLMNRVLGTKQRKSDSDNFGSVKQALEASKERSREEVMAQAKRISDILKKPINIVEKKEYVEAYAESFGVDETTASKLTKQCMREKLADKAKSLVQVLKDSKDA